MLTFHRSQRLLATVVLTAALVVSLAGPLPTAHAAPRGAAVAITGDPLADGFWIGMRDGRVLPRKSARPTRAGAFPGRATDVVAHPHGRGFWRVKGNGRVTAHGRAKGAPRARRNRAGRVIGIAANPNGSGLWRLTARGQVMASGSARNMGGARKSNLRVVDIAAHPTAHGYWIVNARGQVFARGAARKLSRPVGRGVVGITPHPGGNGYWIVKRNGRVHAFGAAAHHGNARIDVPVVDIAAAPDGAGYWVLARDGRVRRFGSARTGAISTSGPPTPKLATVGGITVNASIARPVKRLLAAGRNAGINYGGWGYRSFDRQVQLRRQNCGVRYYDVFVKPSSECSPMTATPGRSMHERGLAIDFYVKRADGSQGSIGGRSFRWLKRNAGRYGLYNLPSEPWHWSTNGR